MRNAEMVGAVGLRQIPEAARKLVEQQRLGYVASVCTDGSPNVSPKGTVSVWDESHLVFADLDSPGTVANLRRDPRVEVNVVDPLLRKGWRFKGVARVFHSGLRFDQGVRFFAQANLMDAPRRIRSIIFIRVQRAAPLISPAYSMGRTEREVVERFWALYRKIYEAHTEEQTRRPRRKENSTEPPAVSGGF